MGSSKASGILLVDKTPGLTSFDCIRVLKRLWKRTDLGHGGTLDRFASGLLPILVGDGLKLARFFLENYPDLPTYWKRYSGAIRLGTATETGDPEGAVTRQRDVPTLSIENVNAALRSFVEGSYEQMPPRYSAKKIGGQRASDLARQGIEPPLKPVRITIRSLSCTRFDSSEGVIHFEAECSKGAYMRALAEDVAQKLETVGYLKELRRTGVGIFRVDDAHTLGAIATMSPVESVSRNLLDMPTCSAFLPSFTLIPGEIELLRSGKVDGTCARLANSGLAPGVFRAMAGAAPAALLELGRDGRGRFLRMLAS